MLSPFFLENSSSKNKMMKAFFFLCASMTLLAMINSSDVVIYQFLYFVFNGLCNLSVIIKNTVIISHSQIQP